MIRIRPYKDSDREKVFSWIHDEDTFYSWSAGVLGDYPLTEEAFQKTSELMRFTALEDREPCGFFTMRNPGEDENELRPGFVLVDPSRRGRGIGVSMMRLALEYAFGIYGAKRVTIAVFEDNIPAYRCYLAAGFVPDGNREEYELGGRIRTALELECVKSHAADSSS